MGARRLAESLELPVSEARALLDKYFESFPRLAQWREEAQRHARQDAARNHQRSPAQLDEGQSVLNACAQLPCAGAGADLIKWAAIRFVRAAADLAGRLALVNMVHDELLVEVDFCSR